MHFIYHIIYSKTTFIVNKKRGAVQEKSARISCAFFKYVLLSKSKYDKIFMNNVAYWCNLKKFYAVAIFFISLRSYYVTKNEWRYIHGIF